MAFTDRFLKVPIYLFDSKEQEISGKEYHELNNVKTFVRINPFEISSYRQTFAKENGDVSFGEDTLNWTIIELKSGEDYTALMPIHEFEKLLNAHQKQ